MLASNTMQTDLYRGEPVEKQPPKKRRKKSVRTQRYNNYMNSPEWKNKRAQRIFMDSGRCQFATDSGICGCTGTARNPLEVHHKTYARIGNEAMSDLVTLCKHHHKATHKQQRSK